jgi:hypothetical protein
MITKFDKYEKIDEGWKDDVVALFMLLTPMFSGIGSDARNPIYDAKKIESYIKTMNIANNNFFVQNVVRDFKDYVTKNNKILNKQKVIEKIDKTPIVYRKNDPICYELYKRAKSQAGSGDPSCWCSTTETGESVIFLAPDASYNSIFHELSHAIESVVKVDPKILDGFNFNYNRKQVDLLYKFITNFEYSIKNDVTRNKEYLSDPSEVWARLNNLKMFLYKHKFLKSPNDEITELLLQRIITGVFYSSLSEKDKEDFRKSDFIEILIFIDLNKYMKINKYVQNMTKNNPNLA